MRGRHGYLSAASWSASALLSAFDADVRILLGSEKKNRLSHKKIFNEI